MATLKDFQLALKALKRDIETQGPAIANTVAITGASIIKQRILRSGFGKKYSTKFIPAYYLRGKELNAGGKAFLEDHNMDDDLVNWGEFRRAQGLQTEHVDLSYTGRMFAGTVPVKQVVAGTKFIVTIGGSDAEVQQKLDWNHERYGDFLAPTTQEKAEIDEIADAEFDKLVKKHFG